MIDDTKEIEKIYRAINEFADAMSYRMLLKQREGFRGWDDSLACLSTSDVTMRAFKIASKVQAHPEKCTRKEMVDLANYAMMIFNQLPEAK